MSAHLVTFADESMSRAAELCVDSALQHGVIRGCAVGPSMRPYTWEWLLNETDFKAGHSAEFLNGRGLAFWSWKPFIIDHAMRQLPDGFHLVYADAGVEFINNVSHVIDRMDQEVFLFGNNWEHAHWCKRDVIDAVWPAPSNSGHNENERVPGWWRFGKQCQASVIFFRVSDYSRKFVKEWLDWCLFEGGRLIDDSPSRAPNHPEFQEHRHDQAILTTLAYREGIKLHWWPASYNDGAFAYEKLPCYAGDNYPVMFNHHRKRNHEFTEAA